MIRVPRTTYTAISGLLLAAAISTAADKPTFQIPEHPTVAAFPPAPVISGSAHERGLAYGKMFKDGIHAFLDEQIYRALLGKPSSKEEMQHYADACGKVVREVCPMIAEEYDGMAEGASLTYNDIILVCSHEELYHRATLPLPKEGHCTAVAVSPADSGDGKTYVGQTWDWMVSVAGKSSITEWRRDEAPSVLAYGYPGMPMGAGMNSKGIALCWTSADLSKQGLSPRVGLPSYTLIAHLLAQNDIESVIREAKRDKHAGWFTFVMADGKGNLVNIEGSPAGVAVEESKDRLARAYFGTRQMTGAKPNEPPKLFSRCAPMYKLLEQSPGKNDRKTLERYFTQPENQILSWRSPRNKTIDVMIFDTTDKKAYLTRGPEFNLDWRTFEFSKSK